MVYKDDQPGLESLYATRERPVSTCCKRHSPKTQWLPCRCRSPCSSTSECRSERGAAVGTERDVGEEEGFEPLPVKERMIPNMASGEEPG